MEIELKDLIGKYILLETDEEGKYISVKFEDEGIVIDYCHDMGGIGAEVITTTSKTYEEIKSDQ